MCFYNLNNLQAIKILHYWSEFFELCCVAFLWYFLFFNNRLRKNLKIWSWSLSTGKVEAIANFWSKLLRNDWNIFSESSDSYELIRINETVKLLNLPDYNNSRPTIFYCFGYTEKFRAASTQTIVKSYIQRGDHNIIVLDWSSYNGGSYTLEAIPNMRKIGELLGKLMLDLQRSDFNINNFHFVGHSLGGQMVGYIGRSVITNSNKTVKLQRITALDPAGPFFYSMWSRRNKPLNKNDGEKWWPEWICF